MGTLQAMCEYQNHNPNKSNMGKCECHKYENYYDWLFSKVHKIYDKV
jgi:hypothetical protein